MIPSYSPKYDSVRDFKKVEPFGALDLKTAFANNSIPSVLSVDEGAFNEIDNPDEIAGRVKDRIDAEVIDRQIKKYEAPTSNVAE